MLNLKNKTNGVTLIAVVVTIIVLLILSVVVFRIISGDDGILNKAETAASETEKAKAREQVELFVSKQVADYYEEYYDDKSGSNSNFLSWLESKNYNFTDGFQVGDYWVKALSEGTAKVESSREVATLDGAYAETEAEVEKNFGVYKDSEFKNLIIVATINKNGNIAWKNGADDSGETGTNNGSGTAEGGAGNSNLELGECCRYVKVNVSKAFLGNMTLSVDIPDDDDIKAIHYFLDNKEVYSGTEKSYKLTGLETEKNYDIYAIVEYNNTKIITTALSKNLPEADIYVSTTGNDATGDGSSDNPYASVSKAIKSAASGAKIFIMAGKYNLSIMGTYRDGSETSYAYSGITDMNKKLEIFGENEKTILEFDGRNSSRRDSSAFNLQNSQSLVRNLTYVFIPKGVINDPEHPIFDWCLGSVKNVFIRVSGSYVASYLYYNGQPYANNVENCTFFHNLGGVARNWSGACNFKNIATNVNTNSSNTNVIVNAFGSSSDTIEQLIEKSKNKAEFNNNSAGVYYGTYAWEK